LQKLIAKVREYRLPAHTLDFRSITRRPRTTPSVCVNGPTNTASLPFGEPRCDSSEGLLFLCLYRCCFVGNTLSLQSSALSDGIRATLEVSLLDARFLSGGSQRQLSLVTSIIA
jgi:hypothetical protein